MNLLGIKYQSCLTMKNQDAHAFILNSRAPILCSVQSWACLRFLNVEKQKKFVNVYKE
jgi:hypothetical protein